MNRTKPERAHFLAGGESLRLTVGFFERYTQHNREMVKISRAFGAVSEFARGATVCGFVFPEGTELPHALRLSKTMHHPRSIVGEPNLRRKAGKELRKALSAGERFSASAYGFVIGVEALWWGGYISDPWARKLGDAYVIDVPHKPGEDPVVPDGATRLKMSEYWVMREADNAAEKARKALEASAPPKPLTPDKLDDIAAGMAPGGVKS